MIVQVGFNEKTSIFGLVEISPVSSGYCLGSCNWLITTGYEKVRCRVNKKSSIYIINYQV